MKLYKMVLTLFTWIAVCTFMAACAPKVRTITVTDLSPISEYPQLAATGGSQGTIYLAWNEEGGVKFTSGKMGEPLGATVMVLQASMSKPKLASAGTNVYIANTFVSSGSDKDIYFTASSDYGGSFISQIEISENDTYSEDPSLAAIGNNVYIAWVDYQSDSPQQANVLFRASIDAGQSFSSIKTLSTNADTRTCLVAASSTNVYIVWCNTNGELHLAKSTDFGANFGATQTLSTNVIFGGEELLAFGDNVYVVWIEQGNNNLQDIFFRASNDGGNNFGGIVNVSNTPGFSGNPKLSAALSNVYIVWEDESPGNNDIYFSRSTNNGGSFQPPQNLSTSSLASQLPRIDASGEYVHVVWQEDRTANWEVAYRRSNNAGETFGSLIYNANGQINEIEDAEPVIIARGIDRYIAWERGETQKNELQIMFYSSTSCPVLPAEGGILPCLK